MASIVIEVPENLKGLDEPIQSLVSLVIKACQARGGPSFDTEGFQVALNEGTAKVEQFAWKAALSCLNVNARAILCNGERFHRVEEESKATYYTPAGPVEVSRTLYRQAGVRNGKTVDPVSLKTGAVMGTWLPCTAKRMAFLVQQGTSREAQKTAEQMGRVRFSRTSFERVGHAVGKIAVANLVEVEDGLLDQFQIPEAAVSLSLALDRVSIPIEEEKPRGRGRPKKGSPRRSVQVAYRQAYCATVTFHDAEGEALQTLRLGRMPGADPDELAMGLARYVEAMLAKAPILKLVFLADGAPEMWDLMRRHMSPAVLAQVAAQLVDFWHLVEKLGNAAQLFENGQARAAEWRRLLVTREDAAEQILRELEGSGLELTVFGKDRPVHDAITYIRNHRDRMNYKAARDAGLPIGSGNVEAACKSLFAMRFKRPGARWLETSGEEIVQLRAAGLSDWWDAAIDKTLGPLRQAVLKAA
jgi:hypothetical protein